MKKVFLNLMLACLLVLVLIPTTFAASLKNEWTTIYEKEEVKDLKTLLKKAKNNETDLTDVPVNTQAELENEATKEKKKPKTYSTTQRLKVEKHADGTTKETFATTTFAAVGYDSNQFGEGWDDSVGVHGYSTIYWDRYNTVYFDIRLVNGGWEIQDGQLGIKNKKVVYGANGYDQNGGYQNTQSKTEYPSTFTYTYTAPSAWVPINSKAQRTFGMTGSCTVFDATTSWSFSFRNQY
jgi:hypothetical protein